jgi:hypothetical protein
MRSGRAFPLTAFAIGDAAASRHLQQIRPMTADLAIQVITGLSSLRSRQELIFEVASCVDAGDRPRLQHRRNPEVDRRPRHAG